MIELLSYFVPTPIPLCASHSYTTNNNYYEKLQKLMTYDINSSYLILFQTFAESVNEIEMT